LQTWNVADLAQNDAPDVLFLQDGWDPHLAQVVLGHDPQHEAVPLAVQNTLDAAHDVDPEVGVVH